MKTHASWILFPSLALGLAACKKSEPVSTGTGPTTPEVPIPAPAKPTLTPDARAEKLGFLRYLGKDNEQVLAVYHPAGTIRKVTGSKLWEALTNLDDPSDSGEEDATPPTPGEQENSAEQTDPPQPPAPDAAAAEELPDEISADGGPMEMFQQEVTIAFGKGTGEQLANLIKLNGTLSRLQMRMLVNALSRAVESGDLSGAAQAASMNPELIKNLITDPEGGMEAYEKFQLPPIVVGLRAPDGKQEDMLKEITGMLANLKSMGEMVSPVEKESAGAKFTGYQIHGAKLAEMAAAQKSSLLSIMDEASADKMIAEIAKKNFVVLAGGLGPYVVLYLGNSPDGLELAAEPKDSLLANDSIAFYDQYLGKDLAMIATGTKKSNQPVIESSRTLAPMVRGLREGLAAAKNLGDTTKLQGLLETLADHEKEIRSLVTSGAHDFVAWHENGLRAEAVSGTDTGAIDWSAKNRLDSLGKSGEAALFLNYTVSKKYNDRVSSFAESLVETAYEATTKAAELNIPGEDFAKFKQGFQLFHSQFRTEVLGLVSPLTHELKDGLGLESALVLDFQGAAPAFPGLPQKVVDQAKIPRLTVVSPVEDRSKLAAAWDKMNTSATSILAKASQMTGTDVPMQKPLSSEKNGFTTWFFALPLASDDFLPSLTLDDKWFAISTSKSHTLDLLGKASSANTSGSGLVFHVDFAKIQAFCRTNLDLATQHAAELKVKPANLAKAKKAIDAMDELDSLHIQAGKSAEGIRTSMHFKTR